MDNIQQTPFVRELASSGTCKLFLPFPSLLRSTGSSRILFGDDIFPHYRRSHYKNRAKQTIFARPAKLTFFLSDKRVRDKALESLTLFIKSRRDLQLVELLKIWKGLFFCFYHSDRPITQQSLARSLSYTLVPSLPPQTLQPFLRAFWITMTRDFHSLDRLRLDKYLYLIRCYVGVAFETLLKRGLEQSQAQKKKQEKKQEKSKKGNKENGNKPNLGKRKRGAAAEEEEKEDDDEGKNYDPTIWNELDTYLTMIESGPLAALNFDPDENDVHEFADRSVQMAKGPDGLRYHLLDIWLDEIEKVAVIESDEQKRGDGEEEQTTNKLKEGIPMELLLRPIERLKEKSLTKTVRKRAAEVLEDERLVEWGVRERRKEEDSEDDDDHEEGGEEEWGGFDD
ncbi:hypothetical protein FQN53_003534 [Emmonsiellopsis sp. PD_33]|nr:hypothetical protein FQN53_003534 [Emmonsiellopsis sp. PD_33]